MNIFWLGLGMGIWLIASPYLLGFSGIAFAKWSSILSGLILAITFAWEIFGEKEPPAEV